jgi:hypothetical protein
MPVCIPLNLQEAVFSSALLASDLAILIHGTVRTLLNDLMSERNVRGIVFV